MIDNRDLARGLLDLERAPEPPSTGGDDKHVERRAQAAAAALARVRALGRDTRRRLLEVARPFTQALAELEAGRARGDHTPQFLARKRSETFAALHGALQAVLMEYQDREARLLAERPRPPAFPVPAKDAPRLQVLLDVVGRASVGEVAALARNLAVEDDRAALVALLPLLRDKLTAWTAPTGPQAPATLAQIARDRDALAAAVADAELTLTPNAELLAAEVEAGLARLRPQVRVLLKTMAEQGKWEGTVEERVRSLSPDGGLVGPIPDLEDEPEPQPQE